MTPSGGRGGKSREMAPLMADRAPGAGQPDRRSNVKARLTPNRRQRTVENDEYARFVRRVVRAYARQVAGGDVDALADMTELATELDEAIGQAVIGLRGARVLLGRDRESPRRQSPGSTAALGPSLEASQMPRSGDHLGTTRYAHTRTSPTWPNLAPHPHSPPELRRRLLQRPGGQAGHGARRQVGG